MRPIVVDASVARKWFFRDRDDEPDAEAALAVLRGGRDGDFALLQPPHFVAEVAAVLVREMPDTALHRLRDLLSSLLVTADERYARKARNLKHVARLGEFHAPAG